MASSVPSPAHGISSDLFDKFEEKCPANRPTNFMQLRTFLENSEKAIPQISDVYQVYLHAMSVAKEIVAAESENPKLKSRFIKILNAASTEGYDFSPIVDMISQRQFGLSCSLEVVNSHDDLKVQEAVSALDMLMEECFGFSIGSGLLRARITSSDGWCVIARDEHNKIIAFALGTCLTMVESSTKVFYYNFCARSPKYPEINFTRMLTIFENDLIEKFNPDFLALCVATENHAMGIYKQLDFVTGSVQHVPTLGRDGAFMTKELSKVKKEIPSYIKVRAAMDIIKEMDKEISSRLSTSNDEL